MFILISNQWLPFKIKACPASCPNVFLNSSAHIESLGYVPDFLLVRT